jgi:hypothetical protein
MLDVSLYQKDAQGNRINFKLLKEKNPEIKVILVRLASVWLVIDEDFEYNFDEGSKYGFDMGIYVNINPSRSVDAHYEVWEPGLKGREPKLIEYDAESSAGQSSDVIATRYEEVYDQGVVIWPWAALNFYTGAWHWNGIKHGWEGEIDFHLAHYPYLVQVDNDTWRVAHSFEEADEVLPIHNNFTPRIPTGVNPDNKIAWQFSSSGRIEGIASPRVDMNYMLRSYYERVFNGAAPPPEPEPVPIVVEVPKGEAVVTVKET